MNSTDLSSYGITDVSEIIRNPSYKRLYQEETKDGLVGYEKVQPLNLGAVNVRTGAYSVCSPKDRFIVMDSTTKDIVWWTSKKFLTDNRPLSIENWNALKTIATKQLSGKRLFIMDMFCGTDKISRIKVRFVMETAWQAHFVKNMFVRPSKEELNDYGEPDFVVLNAAKASVKNYHKLGLNSEKAIALNFTEKVLVLLNTCNGVEMRKGVFTYMNYRLSQMGIASMHASANMDKNGMTALFFGLSGTGKTTFAIDASRKLIADDEIGWDNEGIFNYEGGCHVKISNLREAEGLDVYEVIKENALLENITTDSQGNIDFSDGSIMEDARVSFPICHLRNIVTPETKMPAPQKVIFLTADTLGVFPPVSKLSMKQALYYFLSGFTAKLNGREENNPLPVPAFSPCFGDAFLTFHPVWYAHELLKRMTASESQAYLVNTGWNGTGKRIPLKDTRRIVNAILDGSIEQADWLTIPIFHLSIPMAIKGVHSDILDPRDTYLDIDVWEQKAKTLAMLFKENFKRFNGVHISRTIIEAGPEC